MLILKILWWIFLILLITIIAWAITFGGNILLNYWLVSLFWWGGEYGRGHYWTRYDYWLRLLWILEIIGSYILAVLYVTNKNKYPILFSKTNKLLLVIITIIIYISLKYLGLLNYFLI